jgi:hypothetical protein
MGGAKFHTEPAALTALDRNGDEAFGHEGPSVKLDLFHPCTRGAEQAFEI